MKAFELRNSVGAVRFHDLPGREPAILFVHGLGCTSSGDFPRVAADPALAARRRLLVDLLGSGFSDAPEDFGYAMEDHARTLTELLAGLSLAAVDLVGHSSGGTIAIVVAAMNRGVVRRLVVSESNLDPGGGSFSRPIAEQPESVYVERGHAELVRQAVESGDGMRAASMRGNHPLAVHRGAVSLVRGGSPSWREQLASLEVPRTFLFGAKSLPDPDTERLPSIGVEVRIVPDASHSMLWENPSGYAAAVRDVLA